MPEWSLRSMLSASHASAMHWIQFWGRAPLFAGMLGLAGCAGDASETDAVDRDAFERFVEERSHCESNGECVLVGDGCAAGCGVAVNREHAEEVRDRADALNEAYARHGTSCNFLCAPTSAYCAAGRCGERVESMR